MIQYLHVYFLELCTSFLYNSNLILSYFMEEIGIVNHVSKGSVQVEMKRSAQCERCGACMQISGSQLLMLDVENRLDARKGDRVRLALHGGSIIAASFWVYGVPLLGIVIGSISGALINELMDGKGAYLPVLGGFLGLSCGFLISYIVDKKVKKSGKYRPQIIEIIQ